MVYSFHNSQAVLMYEAFRRRSQQFTDPDEPVLEDTVTSTGKRHTNRGTTAGRHSGKSHDGHRVHGTQSGHGAVDALHSAGVTSATAHSRMFDRASAAGMALGLPDFVDTSVSCLLHPVKANRGELGRGSGFSAPATLGLGLTGHGPSTTQGHGGGGPSTGVSTLSQDAEALQDTVSGLTNPGSAPVPGTTVTSSIEQQQLLAEEREAGLEV